MMHFDIITNENNKTHKLKWLKFQIIHIKYLSRSVETYALMNLIHYQPNTDNIYLYAED